MAAPGAPPWLGDVEPRARRALAALCVTVTTSYGTLYYSFPVLAPMARADTGWSLVQMTAVFSAAQVVAGLGGAPVGRWLESSGPRVVMTTAAVLGAAAAGAIAVAPTMATFTLAWLVAGVAMSGLFYPPAFAAITHWFGAGRVRALTVLTMVAGLASTIFAPLADALGSALGWRGAYAVLALVLVAVVVPLHACALTPAWRSAPTTTAAGRGATGPVGPVVASRSYLALTLALSLGAFGVYAVIVNLVPLLDAHGIDATTAAWALGVGGVGQVLGRLVYGPLQRRTGPLWRLVLVLAACAATTGLLAAVTAPVAAVMTVSLLAGVARGIFTLVQATAVFDRWGAERYATLNGILHTPLMLAIALAPWAGSALTAPLGSYPAVFVALAGIGALGAAAGVFTRPGRRTARP
ncbi:MFS transporter [Halostreptopolyspora alba]|uniref:MFS transporter n=1 Tax=Halostreptopolyspora alba TaxID=2487137 RepID=A0A3N0E3R5_9ACTN|nr:MFS transporter [Nocardiopsaceae bacterium YIM 96095]